MEAYTNLRKCGEYVLLAACDEELLGKILRDGKLVFKVGEEFYKGPKMPVEDAVEQSHRKGSGSSRSSSKHMRRPPRPDSQNIAITTNR